MKRELITDIKDFLESYFDEKECGIYCGNSSSCFSVRSFWGLLAFDDPQSNLAGGKPWCECFCANENDQLGAKIYNKVCELEKELPKIVEPKNMSELMSKMNPVKK